MPTKKSVKPAQQTIKLSLRWVFISMLLVFGIGLLGGLIGQFINPSTLPPLTQNSDRLVTTVQQVTISPNSATASIVEKSARSVVLLAQLNQTTLKTTNVGLILTNDGLIATTTASEDASYVVIDEQGTTTAVDKVGTDALYGLSYFRLRDKVIVPLEIKSSEAGVGTTLVALGRSSNTLSSHVEAYEVEEYVLPSENQPAARQRLSRSSTINEDVLLGTPLLDEEGKVAGMVVDNERGLALPGTAIKESLERVISNRREQNPFTELGFTGTYQFTKPSLTGKPAFSILVKSVTPGTSAAIAGLKTGDSVTMIAEETLNWSTSVVKQLSAPLPLKITVTKQDAVRNLTLEKVPPSNQN